jgi:hypothetical protein
MSKLTEGARSVGSMLGWVVGVVVAVLVVVLVLGVIGACARDCALDFTADVVREAYKHAPSTCECKCDCPDTKYLVKKEKPTCDHGRALQGVCDKWKEALERNEIEVDDAFYARCKQEKVP